ncbi:MAG: pyridoxal-phosphate dependent enzyme [Deltaproteobacteria bacterium]|nr:pyridoxal-phosphate dependent enzyme [Deltaproteobacteria bacterium]
MIPLFDHHPAMASRLPRVPLLKWPTPVFCAERLGEAINVPGLYVKQDGFSGAVIGGNKVRKLEFILGRARALGARHVLTFGCAGSNHALATAVHAKTAGMGATLLLLPQANARYVRENLLAAHGAGARLVHCRTPLAMSAKTAVEALRARRATGAAPFVIPVGGSSPEGVAGFVSAAFELARQVEQGLLPEPDEIYLPMGSMGTAAGLALGIWAAGLKSRVMAVRVVDPTLANEAGLHLLVRRTSRLLQEAEPRFPDPPAMARVKIVDGFLGQGYARFTREGAAAVVLARETEGLSLEGTYTGKTLAALIYRARAGDLSGKTILFWNTHNARDLSPHVVSRDWRELPRPFHPYFKELVQPLDRC